MFSCSFLMIQNLSPGNKIPHMGFSNLFFYLYAFSSIFFSSTYFSKATAFENNTANDAQPPIPGSSLTRVTPFKPGIAIIVGLLTTIFSVTFLALLYMKHCKRGTNDDNSRGNNPPFSSRRNSGINREVIESLPMFKFSSLQGQKDGLECAVCLNVFDPDEVLRLLPKCKHAFHIECIDTWLEAHSTCPLCRYRVDPEDILLVLDCNCYDNNSGVEDHVTSKREEFVSSRKSGRHSHAGEIGNSNSLEIIVENPGSDRVSLDSYYSRRVKRPRLFETWKHDLIRTKSSDSRRASSTALSSRPSSSSSTRRKSNDVENANRGPSVPRRDEHLMVMGHKQISHRLEHRIVISGDDGETPRRRRWSDAHEKELLYLKSEMILGGGGGGGDNESGRKVIKQRSVSEIVGMSRFNRSSFNNTNSSSNNNSISNNNNNNNCGERDPNGSVKRWLAWISQSKQEHEQQKEQSTAVQSSCATDDVL